MASAPNAPAVSRRGFLAAIGTLSATVLASCQLAGTGDGGPAPATGKAVKPGRITFLNWWLATPAKQPYMEEATRRWKQTRPDIEVEAVGEPYGRMREKFLTAQAADTPFDLSFSDVLWARDWYDAGQLLELDRHIRQAPDVGDDKFLRNALQFGKARGKTFGLPVMGPESNVLIINGNLFEAAGLHPEGRDVKTWADLARIAQQLTRRDGETVTRSGYLMGYMTLRRLVAWTNATGAPLFDDAQTKAFYTGQGAAAALEFHARLHNGLRVSVPVTEANRPAGANAILSGAAAMIDGLTSAHTAWFQSPPPGFKFWQIPYPQGSGGRGPNACSFMNQAVISRAARSPDQAFEFARWFCASPEATILDLAMTDAPRPVRALFQSKEWQDRVRERPVLRTRLDIAELPGLSPYRRAEEQQQEIEPLLRDTLTGKLDIKNALEQAQAIASRLLSAP
jgi:ABC-type glycerol-3-phosphate transport system substrate-binding protein